MDLWIHLPCLSLRRKIRLSTLVGAFDFISLCGPHSSISCLLEWSPSSPQSHCGPLLSTASWCLQCHLVIPAKQDLWLYGRPSEITTNATSLRHFKGFWRTLGQRPTWKLQCGEKTLMEEHSSVSLSWIYLQNIYCHSPISAPTPLIPHSKVLSSKLPMNLDHDQMDDMHPNPAFLRHLFFSGVTEESVGGLLVQ